jgi:hypothetical protein
MRISVSGPADGSGAGLVKCVSAPSGLVPRVDDAGGHVVIFTHVQKAAGTTLDRIMGAAASVLGRTHRRASGGIYGQVFGAGKPEALASLAQLSDEDLSGCDYLTGHLPYGVHERFARPPLYVVLLRHPVARLVSQFRFGAQRDLWPRDTRMEELFSTRRLIDNTQTRQIAGLIDRDAPCGDATLEAALGILESRYALAGVTERFDESLEGLIALLGWPDIAYGDRQVTGEPLDPAVAAEAEEVADRHCRLDRLLYEHAAARPFPWSADILQGSPMGAARQAGVLLVAPQVTLNGKGAAYLPAATFDGEVADALRARGVRIVYQ